MPSVKVETHRNLACIDLVLEIKDILTIESMRILDRLEIYQMC